MDWAASGQARARHGRALDECVARQRVDALLLSVPLLCASSLPPFLRPLSHCEKHAHAHARAQEDAAQAAAAEAAREAADKAAVEKAAREAADKAVVEKAAREAADNAAVEKAAREAAAALSAAAERLSSPRPPPVRRVGETRLGWARRVAGQRGNMAEDKLIECRTRGGGRDKRQAAQGMMKGRRSGGEGEGKGGDERRGPQTDSPDG